MPPRHPSRSPLLAIPLLAALAACGRPAPAGLPPPEVLVVRPERRDVPLVREWVGQTRGGSDIAIRARVVGFLEAIHFEEGEAVEEGQLLYTIESRELEEMVAEAEARLAAARTRLANAEAELGRYRPLAEINAVSKSDLDAAVARRDAAAAEVEAAEASVSLARIQLGYAEVRAPIDGLIGISQARVGDYVGQPPNPVVLNTVSSIDPVRVRFGITEREYLEFARAYQGERKRDEAELELVLADGSVHPQIGRVVTLERGVDASTGTITVEASFPNPELVLRPGLYGKVRAVVGVREGALLVPERALQQLQDRWLLWIVDEGDEARMATVEPGPRVDGMRVVLSGLEPDARVVVDGVQRVRPGSKVRVESAASSAAGR